MAVMVTRVYFGCIFETNSTRKRPVWLKLLIGKHYFRVNSWQLQKLLLLLLPS